LTIIYKRHNIATANKKNKKEGRRYVVPIPDQTLKLLTTVLIIRYF